MPYTALVDWKERLKRSGDLAEVTCEKSRAFDIAYAEEKAYLIKVVHNIESFNNEKAAVLMKCASVVGAEPVVISGKGKEVLKENVVYNRHGVNVMNQNTFVNVVNGLGVSVADRGGVKVPIRGLKEARESIGMTRNTLSKLLRVSAEMIRKYESGADPGEDVAKRLVEIFTTSILDFPHKTLEPIRKAFIGKAPFDVALRGRKITRLISFKSDRQRVKNLEGVSSVLGAEPVILKKIEDLL
jgi:predicted transcriptional regulator